MTSTRSQSSRAQCYQTSICAMNLENLNIMPHKFILDQGVGYTPPHGQYAPPGLYVVTAKLPERDGEFEYRIKHMNEVHERAARESELRWVKG